MAKWIKGGRIDDPEIAVSFILRGEPIFDGHKLQNAAWMQNWSISLIKRSVAMGRLHIALPSHVLNTSEAA